MSYGHTYYNEGITQWSNISANICLFAFKVNPAPFLSPSFLKVQTELQQKIQTEVDGYLMFVECNHAVCCRFGAACQEKKESLSISAFK